MFNLLFRSASIKAGSEAADDPATVPLGSSCGDGLPTEGQSLPVGERLVFVG
jgi:hypothetical protein